MMYAVNILTNVIKEHKKIMSNNSTLFNQSGNWSNPVLLQLEKQKIFKSLFTESSLA